MQVLTKGEHAFEDRRPVAKPTTERVVFALSPSERSTTLPSMQESALPRVECLWTEPKNLASPDNWLEFLKTTRPTVLVSSWTTPHVPLRLLSEQALPLHYICHLFGSVKKVVPRDFIAAGGVVTNWGNLVSHTVAEHALLLVLASLRNLPLWHPSPACGLGAAWGDAQRFQTRSLRGKRVGIHGFGNIARELVNLLKPFSVTCMAFSENVPARQMTAAGVLPCKNLDELFMQSEILVECEALTPQTTGIVTARHLRLLPEDAVFVNVARGGIVDEDAMTNLAAQGKIRVASDVFQTEPLPENSPLRDNPNVIVSPHIGGPTSDWYKKCGDFALGNINRYFAGEPLEGVVTLEIYDRST